MVYSAGDYYFQALLDNGTIHTQNLGYPEFFMQTAPHKYRRMIADGSAITLDLTLFRIKFKKKDVLIKDRRWFFPNTRGYF